MKGKRYILLRGRENISQDAKATLRELSVLNRDLYIGYLLKEQFRQVFQTKEVNTATLRLIPWIKMCMKSNVKILRNFARKISEQFNEVMNGIRYRLNSARIESTNAAIKRISQSVWPVRCELSILETAPSLLSATPKKPQNRAFFLSADLKQTRKSALYAIFLLRIRGCDVLIWIRRYRLKKV